jgi:hypothetical protein
VQFLRTSLRRGDHDVVVRASMTGCQKCVSSKLKAIAKAERSRLMCLAKVARAGDSSGSSECAVP